MFGRKKEVYTMPAEKPKKAKGRTAPDAQPETDTAEEETINTSGYETDVDEESTNPAGNECEEEAGDDTGFLPEPPEPPESKAAAAKQKARSKRTKKSAPRPDKVPFFRDKKKVGILLIAASLLVLLVVSPLLNYLTKVEIGTAVVAVSDIPQGKQITQDMIAVVEMPKATLLSIHVTDKALVIDQYAKTDIAKDELIVTPKLSATIPYPNSYLYTLAPGMKAISVTIPTLAAGLSGKLQPGDVISLFAVINDDEKQADVAAAILPELSYVEVLATTNVEGLDVSGNVNESELENALPATVTVAVNDRQAALLAGLETRGALHAALAARVDEPLAANLLAAQADYFKQLEETENPDAQENPDEAPAGSTEEPQLPEPAPAAPPPPAPQTKPEQPAKPAQRAQSAAPPVQSSQAPVQPSAPEANSQAEQIIVEGFGEDGDTE